MRIETPADGDPLVWTLERDPEAFGAVIQMGLGWLVAFQRHHRGESTPHETEREREQLVTNQFPLDSLGVLATVRT